jgi:hypothetical protein
MSEELVNQLTLNFLISKQQLQKLNKKTKENIEQNKLNEIDFYKDRLKIIFNDLLNNNQPDDLLYNVKSTFDSFIEKSIYYFKAHDNSEKLEKERIETIQDDIDYEREEKNIENGNYNETEIDENLEEDEFEEEENIEDKIYTKKNINHSPIIVKSKYQKTTNSTGVEDIQKLPLVWFQNVRQNYKINQIIPRKKEPTIEETTFRDLKKKI